MNEMNDILLKWAGKLSDLLAHSYGRLITLVGFVLGFIAPVKYAFVAMGVAVVGDLLFRVMSLLKKQLRGEVEAKIGKDIANQLDTYGKEKERETEGDPQ